ncbi:methionine--tRNA ligase [Desertimonas flava]|uniref:methionine--tRNA ligase n=1 Tax=Desertimonas flava TaxID=2064846 RepID=UPI000E357906|nr:methionine--tRNA ligase [Desertimonas flava]
MSTTFLSVAIPYVNADPHLGYAYELVQADIAARARRRLGDSVRFVGGTDDYSLKNVLAAEAAGVPTAAFVDTHAERFAALAGPLGLSFDDFVRTSADPRHRPAVERLWRACAANGDLYRKTYAGDYCVGCEQFWRLEELLVDGDGVACCPEHLTPVERVEEDNWFFRLSAFQGYLEELLESGRLDIHPHVFRDEVLSFVRGGLDDISVSRSVRRARGWGVPVPDDPEQVVYVWFDALTYYLSSLGFGDPESVDFSRWWRKADHRVHVIGKGILRFHAVYWPAFLASAGQPAPTRIEVHPYLTVDGAKLSKSAGGASRSAAGPVEVADTYGTDALRWWFASAVSPTVDTDFSIERLVAAANTDLANGAGNVVNRIATLAATCPQAVEAAATAWPIAAAVGLEADVLSALADFDHRGGCRLIVDAVAALNRDLEATTPWRLAKEPGAEAAAELERALARQIASARLIAAALGPNVPALSARLTDRLAAPADPDVAREPAFARLA